MSGGSAYLYSGLSLLGTISSIPSTAIATSGAKFYLAADTSAVIAGINSSVNFGNLVIDWN
jgi:hypothetical protein